MKIYKKLCSIVLCLLMLFASVPVNRIAADDIKQGETQTTETDVGSSETEVTEEIHQTETAPSDEEQKPEKTPAEMRSEEEPDPAFEQSVTVDGIEIKVTAPEGVIPEGSYLSAKKVVLKNGFSLMNLFNKPKEDETQVTKSELEDIENAVSEARDETAVVVSSYTFDISIIGPDGNEIQPDGNIKISFTAVENANQNLDANIYHIEQQDGTEAIKLESEIIEKNDENYELVAETDGFSYYTVEFTYNELQFVLSSDNDYRAELNALAGYLGLSGEVEEYSVSDESLFSIIEENGKYYVKAHQAFTSQEWLKLTIDGVEYEIVVTDSIEPDCPPGSCEGGGGVPDPGPGGGGGSTCATHTEYSGSYRWEEYTCDGHDASVRVNQSCEITVDCNGNVVGYGGCTDTSDDSPSTCTRAPSIQTATLTLDTNTTEANTLSPDSSVVISSRSISFQRSEYYTCPYSGHTATCYVSSFSDWNSADLPTPERAGYYFCGWNTAADGSGTAYSGGQTVTFTSDTTLYAQWTPINYDLTVKNDNDRVTISGTIAGTASDGTASCSNTTKQALNDTFELAPGESKTVTLLYDTNWTVTTGGVSPTYYAPRISRATRGTAGGTSITAQMGEGESVGLEADRKYKTMTFEVHNDNGHSVTDEITLSVIDNVTGTALTEHKVLGSDFDGTSVKTKTVTVAANSTQNLVFNVPENVNVTVTELKNNAGASGPYSNADYLTLLETPTMYANTVDYEREGYKDELGYSTNIFAFARYSNAKDEYKNLNETDTLIIDNQYQRASLGYVSDNNITAKVYECLSEACTVKFTVQATEHDSSNNYYARTVSQEVEGESIYRGTLSGTSNEWTNQLDRYKTYKIVQESFVKDRFYSWDTGYAISAQHYEGYNEGPTSIDLNYKSKAVKVDVYGEEHDPVFAGSTVTLGTGGSIVTADMKQPYTEVNVKAVTGSGVPVADVEMYFGAATDTKTANRNIYVAAPTTKEGIKFSSDGGSGKALQPDIDYTGYLGGSWVTDLSGDYLPFNGYLSEESWYKDVTLDMAHYQKQYNVKTEVPQPTDFNLVIDTAKLTLRAKADAGNLNAVFNVIINNAQYTYGEDDTNGEMIRSTSTIVMHLGEDIETCQGDEINKVCLADDGYYQYTIDVPTDKLITVRHNDSNAQYYNVKQTCDVDTSKYACRSYVAENTSDDHVQTFDFTRKTAMLNVSAQLDNVIENRDIINDVVITIKDTQNEGSVCSVGSYCEEWNEQTSWSGWNEIDDSYTKFEGDTYKFKLNPKTGNPDDVDLIIPAGVHYTISATAKENGGWISNFLNGLFGTNAGYSTTIETGATGISQAGETGNARIVVNDYQYSRANIKSNTKAKIDIYDKDNTLIDTIAFAEPGTQSADLAYDEAPYRFSQNGVVDGYYKALDVTLSEVKQDGTYTIDMEQEEVKVDLSAVGIKGDVKTPIANITYAIGTDPEHIVYSGIIESEKDTIGAEAGLKLDTTYKVYFGGIVNGSGVQEYYAEAELYIPLNAPAQHPYAIGEIVYKQANITVSDIYGSYEPTVTITLKKEWTYDDVEKGVYNVNTATGADVTIWIPRDVDYNTEAEDIFGYSKTVTLEKHVGEATPDLIDVDYSPKTYVVEVEVQNSIYSDVKLENVEYTVRNSDDDSILKAVRTDENGKVRFELVYGPIYYIKESENVYGYKEDKEKHTISLPVAPFVFKEDSTEENYDLIELVINKEPLKYDVHITTDNAILKDPVDDVEYTIYDATDDTPIKTIKTQGGQITIEDLPYGHDYYIIQSDVPFGYQDDDTVYPVELPEGYEFNKPIEMQIDAIPYGFIVNIEATNSVFDDVKVKDVEYTFYDTLGNQYGAIVTDEKGQAQKTLTYGREYYFKETVTAFGYEKDESTYEIKLAEDFNFEEDELDIDTYPVPKKYEVKLIAIDDSGNPVEGAEYTAYDETYENITGEKTIAEKGSPEPKKITNEKGETSIILTYGHEYYIEEKLPGGYIPDDTPIRPQEPEEDKDFDEPEVINTDPKGQKVTIKVSANVSTSFALYKNGTRIATLDGNGNFTITYSQAEVNAYRVGADTPYPYADEADKNVHIYCDKDGKALADDVNFHFKHAVLTIVVSNMIKGAKVTLYNAYTGEAVETITAPDSNDIYFVQPFSQYYVMVNWPAGYLRNNKQYMADISGLNYRSGSAVAPTIYPERKWADGQIKGTVYGVDISSYHGEESVDAIYTVYYAGTSTPAKDVDGASLENIGSGRYYLSSTRKYEVKQQSVPERYVISGDVISAQYVESELAKDKASVSYFSTVRFENDITEQEKQIEKNVQDVQQTCQSARESIIAAFSQYQEADYSPETWARMLAVYQETLSQLDARCTALDEDARNSREIVYNFENLLAQIRQLSEYEPDAKKPGLGIHWWHIVVLIISLLAILASVLIRKANADLGIGIGISLIDILITIFLDTCKWSIIFTALHIIIQLIIFIIRKVKEKDDENEEDDNPPEDAEQISEQTEEDEPIEQEQIPEETEPASETPVEEEIVEPVRSTTTDEDFEKIMNDRDNTKDFIDNIQKNVDDFFSNRRS